MATYVKDLRNAWSTITAYTNTTGKCIQLRKGERTKSKLQEFDARFEQQVPSTKIYFAEMRKQAKWDMKQWTEQVTDS